MEALKDMTAGRGPDACIDAVGTELHTDGPRYAYGRGKQAMRLERTDRSHCARRSWRAAPVASSRSSACMAGSSTKPRWAVMNRSLTTKSGQAHVRRYMRPLLERIQKGEIDPSFVITPPAPARPGATWLHDVPRQGGRLSEGGAQAITRLFSARRSDGTTLPIDLTRSPIVDSTGNLVRIV
jgi:threonine dehydrogenase-like Zn-dependent dehydrogenase